MGGRECIDREALSWLGWYGPSNAAMICGSLAGGTLNTGFAERTCLVCFLVRKLSIERVLTVPKNSLPRHVATYIMYMFVGIRCMDIVESHNS